MNSSRPVRNRTSKAGGRVRSLVGQVGAARKEQPEGLQHPVLSEFASWIPQEERTAGEPDKRTNPGLFILDRQGRIRELNDEGARLLGFPKEWLVGRAFIVFVARQDVPSVLSLLMENPKITEPRTMVVDLHHGATTVPIQISLTTAGSGDVNEASYQLSVVDLSDITRSEMILQDSMASWFLLLHNAPDTIVTLTSRGVITFVNKPMWGFSPHALAKTNILDHVPEEEHRKILHCLTQSFRYQRRSMCDIVEVTDRTRWFNFSFGTPHGPSTFDDNNAQVTTTLVIREISETKEREATLRASGEHFRDLASRIEAVREEERARVAREIHDELGQALTALKLEMAWVEKKTRRNALIRKRMKSMIGDIDNTIEKVRQISAELRPSILDDLGLIAAMEWLLAKFRKRSQIRTEFICPDHELTLPAETSAAVFRVAQEALTNVIRHARATKVTVRLESGPKALRVSIADNGQGMRRNSGAGFGSLGIIGMKERIARLNGEFKIFSEPGSGTRLDISIPI